MRKEERFLKELLFGEFVIHAFIMVGFLQRQEIAMPKGLLSQINCLS